MRNVINTKDLPDEVHETMLREVNAIQKRIEGLDCTVQFGILQNLLARLFYVYVKEEAYATILQDMNRILIEGLKDIKRKRLEQ